MINTIKFMISDTEYILVVPDILGDCCDEFFAKSHVYYINEAENINISLGVTDADTFHGVFGYNDISNKLLKNELLFDNDKRKDPGFEISLYWEELIKDTDVIPQYHLVSNDYYSSWFYNDKDGNIIFDISPVYPWRRQENNERAADPNFIPYSEWIKNYKVVVRRVIPRKTLIQWNEQAKNYIHVFSKVDHSDLK